MIHSHFIPVDLRHTHSAESSLRGEETDKGCEVIRTCPYGQKYRVKMNCFKSVLTLSLVALH